MRTSRQRGFSLLEVMIAMLVLAITFTAIGAADSVAVLHGSRYHGMTRAALVMRGVVLDIEAEYQEEGFPTNSLYGRPCDLPRGFDDMDCEYDLVAMEIEPAELAQLVEEGIQGFTGGMGMEDALGGGAGGAGGKTSKGSANKSANAGGGMMQGLDLGALSALPGMGALGDVNAGGLDPTQLMMFSAFLGPEGDVLMNLCQINLEAMITRFVGMAAFFPMIVDEAAKQTRKLVVTIKWNYGPRQARDFKVTTFIVGVPEEEMRKLREMENLQEVGEDMQNLMSPDGGVPGQRGSGGSAGTRSGGTSK